MRKGYDFSKGTRGKHVGKRLRIVGDNAVPLVVPKGTLSKHFKLITPEEEQELGRDRKRSRQPIQTKSIARR